MWTGNKPPLLPKTASKREPGTIKTAAITPQNLKQNAELEALRQKGLTTLLNRHFTETTRQVAAEKAAAEATLKEIEARKALQGEFKASGNTELSPLDALYVSANQWRAECRRKEKETILLYQRYVHKFGDSGQVELPAAPEKAIPEWAREENITPRHGNKQPIGPMSTQAVSSMKKQIESALNEYLERGGLEMPSVESLGKDKTFQQVFHKHQADFQNYYLRQREKRGIDAKTSLPKTREQVESDRKVYVGPGAFTGNGGDPLLRTIGDRPSPSKGHRTALDHAQVEFHQDEDGFSRPYFVDQDFDEEDDRSVVSGLTTLNSVETRRVLQDCEQSVATFLLEEHKAIREMMDEDNDDALTRISSSDGTVDESVKAADDAEHMVQQMKGILDDFQSTKSGIVNDLIQENEKKCRVYETANKEEDWVIYYDETMKREYYHERNTNRTQWEPPERDLTSQSSFGGSGPFYYNDMMPEKGKSSRYARYKRKQRKSRRRRKAVAGVLTTVAVAVGAAYYYRPEEPVSALPEGLIQITNQGVALYDRFVVGSETTDEANLVEKQEQIQKQIIQLLNKVYGFPMVPLMADETNEPVAEVCGEEASKELFLEAMEGGLNEVAVAREEVAIFNKNRPWVCHIPLSYLFHPGCRKMASEQPLFDLHALVSSMMQ